MENSSYKRGIIKFGALQFQFWALFLVFNGFIVYYLTDIGYSNTEVGIALSAMMLMGIFGRFFWGYVCDVKHTFKKVFILSFIALILVANMLRFLGSFYLVTAIMGMIGFFQMPQTVVLDTWIMSSNREIASNYGFIRACGSLGYALMAVVYGKLLNLFGWDLMFISYTFFAITLILIAIVTEDKKAEMSTSGKLNLKSQLVLFRNKEYMFIQAVALLIYAPFLTMVYYLPVILKNAGGTTIHNGMALFISAFSEVPALILSRSLLRKYRPVSLILFSSVFFILKIVILWVATSPAPIIWGGLLQALSFAVFLPSMRSHIYNISPENLKTTAQSFSEAVYTGIGGIIASSMGGLVLDKYGMNTLFILCTFVNFMAIILLAVKFLASASVKGEYRIGNTE